MEKNFIYSQSDMNAMNKGILDSFLMEAVNPTEDEALLTPATEAAKTKAKSCDDCDDAEEDDLYDDAENDEDISDEDVFITEIDGDDDPCEEEDDFYDSAVESIDATIEADTQPATESADDYDTALESAVYQLNEMDEDDVISVLESLDPEMVQDLVAKEQCMIQAAMESCDDDDDEDCDDDDDECDEDDDECKEKKKKKKQIIDDDEDPIAINSFSTVLNPVNTFEKAKADDYVDLFDDDDFDDDEDDDL